MSKDLFSEHAETYAKYRPEYPIELYHYILQFVNNRNTAWDCATGNGQAAYALSEFFNEVYATDISQSQLRLAKQKENITYSVHSAERSSFPDNSFNLVTVAQAYHWLDLNSFQSEARRVSVDGGVIAVWCYGLTNTSNEALNAVLNDFYFQTVGSYWDPERKYIDEKYQTIPFDFKEMPSKDFTISVNWSMPDLLGYLNSWSSVQKFIKANDVNPLDELAESIRKAWNTRQKIEFIFPLFLRIGVIEK